MYECECDLAVGLLREPLPYIARAVPFFYSGGKSTSSKL